MKTPRRRLAVPLLLATLAFVGCDVAGPTGPLSDLDDQLMGTSAMQATKTTSKLNTTTSTGGGQVGDAQTTTTNTKTNTNTTGLLGAAPRMVRRTAPLTQNVGVSQRVGPGGGTVTLPREAGISVKIPRGALADEVEISVTALAGEFFAIHAGPHGLQFLKQIEIHFDKNKVSGGGDLVGVYWAGDPASPTILEVFQLQATRKSYVLKTTHFSGYALASL